MAQSAYAYDVSPQRRLREVERPPLRALPGKGLETQTRRGLAPLTRAALFTCSACFVFALAVGLFSISMTNATVQTLMDSESISASITEARSVGLDLEVQYSIATNPTRIQEAAAELGMVPSPGIAIVGATEALSSLASEAVHNAIAAAQIESDLAVAQADADLAAAQAEPDLAAAPAEPDNETIPEELEGGDHGQ